jgi:hypothetical protein
MGDQGQQQDGQQQTEETFDAFDELGLFGVAHDWPETVINRVMEGFDFAAIYTPHRRSEVEAKNPVLAQKLAAYLDEETKKKAEDAAAEAEAKRIEELPEPDRVEEEARIAALPEPITDEEAQRLLGVGDSLQRASSYEDAWAALDERDRAQLPRLGFNEPFSFTYNPKESS